jgi:DNA-binding NarL/FixJ family response regulator
MTIRILVVDDYEPFRRAVRLLFNVREDLQIVGEASDGLEAFQKAQELQPDLVLLDIDLPILNGIQVARRLRDVVPRAKVVFLSVESSSEMVQEALSSGAMGYVYKLQLASELLPAVEAVLRGKQFVSSDLKAETVANAVGQVSPHRHEMLIYSDEAVLLDAFTQFIATALRADRPVIAAPTRPHLDSVIQSLNSEGIDVDDAIRRKLFIPLDATTKLSSIMVNDMPDRLHCMNAMGSYVDAVRKSDGDYSRIAFCGECAPVLLSQGNAEGAIRLEEFSNSLPNTGDLDILCAYPMNLCTKEHEKDIKRICAEHSAVSSR